MAGERIGKTYEAILKLALDYLCVRGVITGNVFWNETPTGLSVEPDFLVGPDKDHPEWIFLVTHSNAPKKSPIKTWRNLGELCEAKMVLTPIPKAFNVVFDSVIEENLKRLQENIFDAQIIVGDTTYGQVIRDWVIKADAHLPAEQDEKALAIQKETANDRMFMAALDQLAQEISVRLSQENHALSSLWGLERNRRKSTAPTAKKTFIRRGLSKLLIFPNIDDAIELYRKGSIAQSKIPQYIIQIGLAKKAIATVKPSDEEIQGAFDTLSDNEIRYLYHSCDNNEVITGITSQLRSVSSIQTMVSYVLQHYYEISNEDILSSNLKSLFMNPSALVASTEFNNGQPPHNVWLFDIILEIIKSASGKTNGYGHAKLAEEIADPSGPAAHFSQETRSFLLSPWGHLSDWTGRTSKAMLPDEVIDAVACVLSFKLRQFGYDKVKSLCSGVISSYIHNLIEQKLCTYNGFAPLYLLMKYHKIATNANTCKITSCFAEKGNLPGRTGENTVLHISNTIINWQTATDSGRDHKRKELSGRAVGIRYTWDEKRNCFVPRSNVEKLVLLLDGTWGQKDINALISAGWDEIYYPDEIERLKAAIV